MNAPDPASYPAGLFAQFRRNLPLYAVGSLLLVVQQGLMAKRDFLVRDAVDAAIAARSDAAVLAAATMLGVSIAAALARVASRVTIFTGGRNVEYELRAVLLARLHALGPSFFRRMPTGEIMSRATNDLAQVRLLLGFGLLTSVASLTALVSALYVMLTISGRLTLASFVTLPPLLIVARIFSWRLFRTTRANQESIGQMSDRVLASLAGVRVVRSFALEDAEAADFERGNRDYLDKSLALARLRGAMGPLMGALSAVGVLVVFWYGGRLVFTGAISRGDFVSFWLALLRLTWPLLALGFVTAIVQRGRAGYERLRTIFDAVPDIMSGSLPAPPEVRGALSVRGLTFGYAERDVVRGVSFEVPAGTSLALVGRTGSGKSTIAILLARLMPTPPAAVFLDGADVCDLPLSTVRAGIGYAQQDAFLFSTTVSRNIGFALDAPDSPTSMVRIRDAAREAQVLEEALALPEQFDTVVGERGVQLSGGQKQRIALARALVWEPVVLLLDDPLSAVDAKTEAAILDAIERQAKRRTVVLVTHRIAAAARCGRVIVLDRGTVVDQGTHEELLARPGVYATFAEEQRVASELSEVESLGAGAA